MLARSSARGLQHSSAGALQRSSARTLEVPRPEHISADMGIQDGKISDDGILAGLKPGSVWIEHSTTDFENTIRIREEVEKRGCKAVAAPLTGGMQILIDSQSRLRQNFISCGPFKASLVLVPASVQPSIV